MALTQRLEFRQSQSLVMTPQLMQAIKLLQLSNLDLSAFVEEELERNPLLERASDGPEAPVAGEPAQESAHERSEFSESGDSARAPKSSRRSIPLSTTSSPRSPRKRLLAWPRTQPLPPTPNGAAARRTTTITISKPLSPPR